MTLFVVHHVCFLFRQAKYLKAPRTLQLHILRMHLKCLLKKRSEQIFIMARLKLLDQQFCIDLQRNLWQSYFDLGSANQLWPVCYTYEGYTYSSSSLFSIQEQVARMASTNDYTVIEQFVLGHLTLIDRQSSQCKTELATQFSRCPSTLVTTEMDTQLKQLIAVHQKRLLKKNACLLAKFKACIEDHNRWKKLSSYHLTIDQV